VLFSRVEMLVAYSNSVGNKDIMNTALKTKNVVGEISFGLEGRNNVKKESRKFVQ